MSSKSADLKQTGMNRPSREVAERRVAGRWGVRRKFIRIFVSLRMITSKERADDHRRQQGNAGISSVVWATGFRYDFD